MNLQILTKAQTYSTWRFIVEITVLAFLSRFFIVFPTAIILYSLGINLGNANIEHFDFSKHIFQTLFFVTVIGPFIETILFQVIPISILKLLRFPARIILFITTLIFALAHLEDGLINFIGMLPIGFLFNWSFFVRSKKSFFEAFFVVFVIHGLTNLLAIILYIFTV